jgi:hypothetical protein
MYLAGAGVALWFSLAQVAPAATAPPPPTASAPSAQPAPPPGPLPRVSLTFSPLQLSWPVSEIGISHPFAVYELAGELRVHEKVSFMVFGGVGEDSAPGAPGVQKVTDTEWHYGLQGRYYLAGDFRRGLPIGAEIYWFHFGSEAVFAQSGDTLTGGTRGRAAGPFLGYKYTFDRGFTIDGELGWVYVTMTEEDYPNHGGFKPIINLKLGWSF